MQTPNAAKLQKKELRKVPRVFNTSFLTRPFLSFHNWMTFMMCVESTKHFLPKICTATVLTEGFLCLNCIKVSKLALLAFAFRLSSFVFRFIPFVLFHLCEHTILSTIAVGKRRSHPTGDKMFTWSCKSFTKWRMRVLLGCKTPKNKGIC